MSITKKITVCGIGIALFVALSLCLQVPVFENYYLCLGYLVMAVYCYCVSPLSGVLVGTLGTVLYCFLINGLRGMPGWALGNVAIGFIMGYCFIGTRKFKHKLVEFVVSIICIIGATCIGILGIKSGVECFLYAQPFVARVISNTPAFIADVVMLIVSYPICKMLHPHIKRILGK